MNAKKILALILLFTLTSASVWAGDGGKKKKKGEKGDKKAEIERRFGSLDANKDGSISKDEFIAYFKERHGNKKR